MDTLLGTMLRHCVAKTANASEFKSGVISGTRRRKQPPGTLAPYHVWSLQRAVPQTNTATQGGCHGSD